MRACAGMIRDVTDRHAACVVDEGLGRLFRCVCPQHGFSAKEFMDMSRHRPPLFVQGRWYRYAKGPYPTDVATKSATFREDQPPASSPKCVAHSPKARQLKPRSLDPSTYTTLLVIPGLAPWLYKPGSTRRATGRSTLEHLRSSGPSLITKRTTARLPTSVPSRGRRLILLTKTAISVKLRHCPAHLAATTRRSRLPRRAAARRRTSLRQLLRPASKDRVARRVDALTALWSHEDAIDAKLRN